MAEGAVSLMSEEAYYFQPEKPSMQVEDLRETDPISYKILIHVLTQAATECYANPAVRPNGLEGTLETLIGLVDKGIVKISYDEEDDVVSLTVFNPLTGKYYKA